MKRLLALLLLSGGVSAQEPVQLAQGVEPVPLAGHIAALEDPQGQLTLADVRAPELAARFQPIPGDAPNHGYTTSAYWYRFVLQGPAEGSAAYVFALQFQVLQYLDIHLTRADGSTRTFLTGARRPMATGELEHRTFAVPIEVAPSETIVVHLRVQTSGTHAVPLVLLTRAAFDAKTARDHLWYGGVFGSMLVIALYNLILFLAIRDRTYGYYVAWLLCLGVLTFIVTGYARQLSVALLGSAPLLIFDSVPHLILLTNATTVLFAREFLSARERAPRLHAMLGVLALVALALMPVLVVAPYGLRAQVADLTAAVYAGAAILAATVLAWRGLRTARVYLVGWSPLMLALIFFMASQFGLLPIRLITAEVLHAALLLAMTLLSVALADRINNERRERERLSRLKRFFSPDVASAILDEGEATLLAPKRREITVLFTDLRGFTAFSAESEPEEVIRVLREYREVIVALAAKHHGTLEHFSGDGVMVYFNAPVEIADPEASAARMAFDLQRELGALCEIWRKRTHELGVGIGMASGFATVGAVGFKDRMDYSVIGDVTNLAARLCAQAQHGQILVSRKLLLKIEKLVAADHLGEREMKGLPKPVTVYNLTGMAAATA